jgi:hypothetical protein
LPYEAHQPESAEMLELYLFPDAIAGGRDVAGR